MTLLLANTQLFGLRYRVWSKWIFGNALRRYTKPRKLTGLVNFAHRHIICPSTYYTCMSNNRYANISNDRFVTRKIKFSGSKSQKWKSASLNNEQRCRKGKIKGITKQFFFLLVQWLQKFSYFSTMQIAKQYRTIYSARFYSYHILYLCIDNWKVLVIIFSRDNSPVSFCMVKKNNWTFLIKYCYFRLCENKTINVFSIVQLSKLTSQWANKYLTLRFNK